MEKNVKTLVFSVILNKKTNELILREGDLLNLKIPKHWQKPDQDAKSPALWTCHLPENSWGITIISLFATELEIKKKVPNSNDFLTYRGNLEITSENDSQIFYHCQLKLLEDKKVSGGAVLMIFLGIGLIGLAIWGIMSSNS